ncbi:monocarboxylate permease-like protein [Colletotrichum truncatum]|uniref:Monocarboxylate permease-like protein n=1 Tax=Colletotrichum truncatum TaxID=5467 RepID=A0ACC3ZLF8_COLTU|nr:monocarboxylate permease-like protein [Colletotrichum truncatum]KAF6787008.1 monocarboxylate permease-like protein [Colletotrichum truncatum]
MSSSSQATISMQQVDPEKATPGPAVAEDMPAKSQDDITFPEGGRQAWLVAIGNACVLFCTTGYSNTFGVFQAYYTLHQFSDKSADAISWIGSTQAFLGLFAAIVGGPLFDRYGAWVIRPAAVVYLFAIMMTSLCKEYWQFMLAQGILHGTSSGILMFSAMAATPQYFRKRRGVAMGLAMTGSSIGAIIYPIVLSKLLNDSSIGFGWSVRITGFIMVPAIIFSLFTVKARLPPRQTNFLLLSAFKDKLYVTLIPSLFFLFIGMFVPLFYLPTYGIYHGMSESLASYLVAMINAASIFGRILPGIMGDKVGQLNALLFAGTSTAIMIFCWPEATTQSGIIAFSVLFGFCSGAIISGGAVAMTLCPKDVRDMGTYLGMGTALASFAALMGPPVTGSLFDRYGSFEQVSIFSGAMCMAGAVLVVLAKAFTPQGVFGKV